MKRYKEKKLFSMEESHDGPFVYHNDVIDMMSKCYGFVLAHADDVENDIDDFGELKPILELVRSAMN